MNRPKPEPSRLEADALLKEAARIDRLYGLEPVIEVAVGDGLVGGVAFHSVQCPYCGEAFDTAVDCSAGSAAYVEDCAVCCQPIEFCLTVGIDGALAGLSVMRGGDSVATE